MAEFGQKPEELLTMFSEMLREMDRNTIRYMMDDMKEEIKKQAEIIAKKDEALAEKDVEIARLQMLLTEK